ncbi:hypothetical protein [Novosphingobium album (ex Liu et al. 2023)]|uniref:Uncharacterized protein n=1 Tax=Novosphingobium album (ex Liu et al. 2023) TaxID=3031130 RepID=A0ABT5WNK4_9SPHN|nr:hypothetical protein [Novosphingobium album (ex Liu et al. 2023)]MDE8651616.1 hypothetical protein [Novosphingobium album (ex Liu et al. 2023)]
MEKQSSHRIGFTLGMVAVVLVLVRLLVGTPEEESALSRAAAAQLAARQAGEAAPGDDAQAVPEPAKPRVSERPAPDPVEDQDVVTMDAVPDEQLIDDASGSDPSAMTEPERPEHEAEAPATRSRGVPVDHRAY